MSMSLNLPFSWCQNGWPQISFHCFSARGKSERATVALHRTRALALPLSTGLSANGGADHATRDVLNRALSLSHRKAHGTATGPDSGAASPTHR
jgi:hypothetical protein